MCARNTSHNETRVLSQKEAVTPIVAAAHELKTPLVLIRQLALAVGRDDNSQKNIERIILTAEQALRTTNNLTTSSRLDDAMFNLEPVNPEQLCKEILYELEPLLKAKNRSYTIYASRKRDPLLLIANRDLLRRIICNFTENALHYSEDNTTIKISITRKERGSIIRVSVRDYGPALGTAFWKSLKSKIGVSLQPVHNRPMSSGLGLYMASKFANKMNADIGTIRHKDGASFFIDLQASRQIRMF